MTLTPWLTFRHAREALRDGKPDEAHRLLAPFVEQGYRKAIRLTREVANAYLDRAERFLRADNTEAAWAELLIAESLNTGEARAVQIRATLIRYGVNECGAALEAGKPTHAKRVIARLHERAVRNPQLAQYDEAVEGWISAAEHADRGDFVAAKELLTNARLRLQGFQANGIDHYLAEVHQRHERFQKALPKLYASIESRDWKDVVQRGDEILAVAPDHREVRSLQAKAWSVLQPGSGELPRLPVNDQREVPLVLAAVGGGAVAGALLASHHRPTTPYASNPASSLSTANRPIVNRHSTGSSHVPGTPLPKRFILWVDGVGGYLVCLNSRITFGQAIGEAPVDVPVFAEMGRLHAEITRDADGGYIVESARETSVNGHAVQRAVLSTNDRITFGTSCQFLFHRPVSISSTVRLEVVSGHRLPWAVDGIILMDQALILGLEDQVHIPLQDDNSPKVILHRTPDGLAVKCSGKFKIDNRPCTDRAEIPLPSVLTSESFTFALDPVGPRV